MEHISTIILLVLLVVLFFAVNNPKFLKLKMLILVLIAIYFIVEGIVDVEYRYKNFLVAIFGLMFFYRTYKKEYLKQE